ncbi:SGNH/GDSL hydrolase family protein [Bernardetia sp. OM2101]|uniref:SGNH/GDSL hydrolase family protein n=1 Tax=Bernardetia sp. OM2101 TaxID=3344876 RepID=UPI0035CF29E5
MKLYNKFFSRWTGVAMLATMGLFACQPEIEVETPVSGSADFTTYVALGNSLTAGYADGGVYRESQINSYPEMMAKSMKEVNSSLNFSTPLMPAGNGSGYLQLVNGSPSPVAPDPSAFASVASGGPYQNMGVPGARVKNLTQVGYGSAQGNPYYARFASNPGATIAGEAAAQNPTFFTLWIGNNDVLGYATSGGDQGGDAITPVEEFRTDFDKILTEMDGASGGAIANIPNILAAPYFTTATYNAFVIDAALAAQVNAGIEATIKGGIRQQAEANRPAITAQVTAGLRQARIDGGIAAGLSEAEATAAADAYLASAEGQADIAARVQGAIDAAVESNYEAIPSQFRPTVSEGANPFIIRSTPSATNPTGLRSATPDDLILLTVLAYTASPEFQALPVLPESLVLDVSEQAKVNAAIDAYNGVIQDAAGSKYAYVDINDFFSKVISGFSYQGVGYSPSFVTGGAFSLDGIHLTQRGYALAGNEFIKAINAKYNAKLSLINVNDYRGVLFP